MTPPDGDIEINHCESSMNVSWSVAPPAGILYTTGQVYCHVLYQNPVSVLF